MDFNASVKIVAETIKSLYPDARGKFTVISDDKVTSYIEWLSEDPNPIDEQLVAANLSQGELEIAKRNKLQDLAGIRFAKQQADYDAIGYTWPADNSTRQLLFDAINGFEAGMQYPADMSWETVDYQDVPVTLQELKQIAQGVLLQLWQVEKDYRLKKAQVNNATTVAEVEAVTWL